MDPNNLSDEIEVDDDDLREDCGRWDENAKGGMSPYCRFAGTVFCYFECPFRYGWVQL